MSKDVTLETIDSALLAVNAVTVSSDVRASVLAELAKATAILDLADAIRSLRQPKWEPDRD